MKFRLIKFLLIGTFLLPIVPLLASQGPVKATTNIQQEDKVSAETLSKIALGSSVAGLVMIAIPPLSFLGLAFGIMGFGLGLFSRKKVKKKVFSRLAIILGSAGIFYFLVALGLVAFY